MLSPTSIAQINRALENSFANIKKDMTELKTAIGSHTDQYSNIRKDLEDIKKTGVTSDKINVIKIKLGEVSEELKKTSESLKTLMSPKSLQRLVEELNAKLIQLDVRVADVRKNSVTETEVKTLTTHINTELNRMASDLRSAETRRDDIRRKDIEDATMHLTKRITSANEDIAKLRTDMKVYVDKEEVKRILDDINKDFVGVKNEISAVYKREGKFVKENEVKELLNKVNKEFDGVSSEIESLKNNSKAFITEKQIKGLIDDISDEFNDLRSDVVKISRAEDIEALRKEVKRVEAKNVSKDDLSKELKKIDRESAKAIPESYGASIIISDKKIAKKEVERGPVSHKKKHKFGSFMIFASFLLLISSIYSFYMQQQVWTDNLAIAAVIVFVLGMALRAYAIVKSK